MPTLSGLVQRKAGISDAFDGSTDEFVFRQGLRKGPKMKRIITVGQGAADGRLSA
jgi:hypothetical protein